MVVVRVPRPLQAQTGHRAEVEVEGPDVRAALDALIRQHPGVGERVLDARGHLQRFVNVFVGDDDVRGLQGLATRVDEGDVITIVPAVAGGASTRSG